jgi:hypothetical protein
MSRNSPPAHLLFTPLVSPTKMNACLMQYGLRWRMFFARSARYQYFLRQVKAHGSSFLVKENVLVFCYVQRLGCPEHINDIK